MDTLKEDKAYYASARHREVLQGLLAHPEIERSFFLTGGTALSVFYLHHRVSDVPDLFTLEPMSLSELDPWIRARWKDYGDERPRAEFENGRTLKVHNILILPAVCAHLFTGPRYLSSQARVSLMYSTRGGMWSVS